MENVSIQNAAGFDLFKVARGTEEVQLSPSTIRKLGREGKLNLYSCGKILFASRSELAALIKSTRHVLKRSRKMAAVRAQGRREAAA